MSDTNPPGGGFGDFEDRDAFDTSGPDAEQVARKLQLLRSEEGIDGENWDDLTDAQKLVRIAVIIRLLEWARLEGWVT